MIACLTTERNCIPFLCSNYLFLSHVPEVQRVYHSRPDTLPMLSMFPLASPSSLFFLHIVPFGSRQRSKVLLGSTMVSYAAVERIHTPTKIASSTVVLAWRRIWGLFGYRRRQILLFSPCLVFNDTVNCSNNIIDTFCPYVRYTCAMLT